MIRRLRRDPRLFDPDHPDTDRVFDAIGVVKRHSMDLRERIDKAKPELVGPYSGLTRSELRQSGTCETDWY